MQIGGFYSVNHSLPLKAWPKYKGAFVTSSSNASIYAVEHFALIKNIFCDHHIFVW
jgi:hypothetical protein